MGSTSITVSEQDLIKSVIFWQNQLKAATCTARVRVCRAALEAAIEELEAWRNDEATQA